MIKMYCDRCGEEIKGTTFYTVSIYAEDINPSPNGMISCETAAYNLEANTFELFNIKKHYCEKCKNKIEDFINERSINNEVYH